MRKRFLAIMIVLGLFFLAACGGGGAPDSGGDTGGDTGGGTTPTTPAFTGFDFTLAQGDFWEYQWDYYDNDWYQGGTPTTVRDIGRI